MKIFIFNLIILLLANLAFSLKQRMECIANNESLKCLPKNDFRNNDYNILCKYVKDEKCVSAINGVFDDACDGRMNEYLKFQFSLLKYICENNEEGKECPVANTVKNTSALFIRNSTNIENILINNFLVEIPGIENKGVQTEVDKTLNEVCKSKTCSDNLVTTLTDYYKYYYSLWYSRVNNPKTPEILKEIKVQEKRIKEDFQYNKCAKAFSSSSTNLINDASSITR